LKHMFCISYMLRRTVVEAGRCPGAFFECLGTSFEGGVVKLKLWRVLTPNTSSTEKEYAPVETYKYYVEVRENLHIV
jgi:hypothetical protein